MADIAASILTTAKFVDELDLHPVATFSGKLETIGDRDWISLDILPAGLTLYFYLHSQTTGFASGDAFLTIFDAAGVAVPGAFDDDSGSGFNSFLAFTPATSGNYYLEARQVGGNPGSYTALITLAAPATITALNIGDDVFTVTLAAPHAFGEQGNDQLTGDSAGNILSGGLGDDILLGLGNNDFLYGDAGDDAISGGAGTDDMFGGAGNDRMLGEDDQDRLTGGAGDDLIDGGAGDDIVRAGAGDDIVTLGSGNDTYTLELDGGADLITDFRQRFFTATLNAANEVPANGSPATGNGTVTMNAARTSLDLTLNVSLLTGAQTGAHIHNAAVGVNGPVIINLTPPAASGFNHSQTAAITTTQSAQMIAGNTYFNVHTVANPGGEIRGQITAVAGDTGADKFDVGQAGIRTFATWQLVTADVSGNATTTIFKNGVATSVTFQGVAEAVFTAADFLFNTTTFGTTFTGTANVDDVFGAGGSDILNGLGGDDRLFGEEGTDTLDGGTGADTMYGGAGNDTYTCDIAGDQALETIAGAAGGIDTVLSATTRTLGFNVENLTLTGDALNGVGNTLANTLTGNYLGNFLFSGNDLLADTMIGNGGNDAYYVNSALDIIVEVAGDNLDRVRTSVSYNLTAGAQVEILETQNVAGATVIHLFGNEFGQTVAGNAANNSIDGRLGNDILTGNAGLDVFLFSTALNATTNLDKITDFNVADDSIGLDINIAGFAGIPVVSGHIDAASFKANATGVATDTSDRIIYNTTNGFISYDSDGNGLAAAVRFAQLTNAVKPVLTELDFLVIG